MRIGRYSLVAAILSMMLLLGCIGFPATSQTIAAASNLFYEDGQAYIQTTAYLNTPAELYASNVPGFNGLKLDSGMYANATGKVTILVSQSKRDCVYPLVPRTGYVGGIFGFGAIRVTEFIPANPTKDFSYDVSVNGITAATGLSPFNVKEVPFNLPYNNVLAQTPIMKIVGLDALAGSQQCPSASDFIIIQVADTLEARSNNLAGAVRIYQQSIYYNNKNNLFGADVGFLPLTYPTAGFDANAPQYTYPSSNIGSALVAVKVPLGAFNIVTYRPAAAGRAQIIPDANGKDCVIQDAEGAQQTNLQFTYKNIGEMSVFDYIVGSGKYVYASGDRNSGAQVAAGALRTVQLRVIPNADAKGTQVLPVSICGESGICTQVSCIGNVLEGTGTTPPPLPPSTPGGGIVSTACIPIFEKTVTKTEGGFNIGPWNFGGTQVGSCAPDIVVIGILLAAFGLMFFLLGLVVKDKRTEAPLQIMGGIFVVAGLGMLFLSIFIENAVMLLLAGVGIGLIALVFGALYLYVKP